MPVHVNTGLYFAISPVCMQMGDGSHTDLWEEAEMVYPLESAAIPK